MHFSIVATTALVVKSIQLTNIFKYYFPTFRTFIQQCITLAIATKNSFHVRSSQQVLTITINNVLWCQHRYHCVFCSKKTLSNLLFWTRTSEQKINIYLIYFPKKQILLIFMDHRIVELLQTSFFFQFALLFAEMHSLNYLLKYFYHFLQNISSNI